jgi:diamine N-acetyltransferase
MDTSRMTDTNIEESNEPRSARQAFLVGPSYYLRPIELADAASAPIWDPSPYPAPVEVIEERLKEKLGDDVEDEMQQHRLLICRRSDDRPVGSVKFSYFQGRECAVGLKYDPNRSLDEWAAIWSEVMTFTLPWLIEERHMMMVLASFWGEHPVAMETANALGMRKNFRLRESLIRDGQRYDWIGFEALHPGWVRRLGMPRGMEEGPVEREIRQPAPLTWPDRDEAPENAVIAGDRLYLRPLEPDDAALVSQWMREDTEISYPEGRFPHSPVTLGQQFTKIAKASPPSWARFAIVLRETDELIGANGLEDVDLIRRTGWTETEIWRPEHRSKGYGTEAKHLLLEYCFERLGMHTVFSWVSEYNTRSATALRKQGYRDAGYFAWSDFYKDGFTGGFCFDYLASEWRAARR